MDGLGTRAMKDSYIPYPVELDLAYVKNRLGNSRESLLEKDQDGLCSFFKELPLLHAHCQPPSFSIFDVHLPLPNDNGCFNSVFKVDNLVFC